MKNEGGKQPKPGTTSFSDELVELQELVRALEADELSLEDSLKHYESGVKIVSRAKQLLDNAEQEVLILESSMTPAVQDNDEDDQRQ